MSKLESPDAYIDFMPLQALWPSPAGETFVQDVPDKGVRRRSLVVLVAAAIPTLLALFYFIFLASTQYTSEAKVVVRSAEDGGLSDISAAIASINPTGGGGGGGSDYGYTVVDYWTSRDAIADLNTIFPARAAFDRPAIDAIARFGGLIPSKSDEAFYKYFNKKLYTSFDPSTGIIDLTVTAFDPRDAQAIANGLIANAEKLVNRLSDRAKSDMLRSTRQDVADAQKAAATAEENLTRFRLKWQMDDPAKITTSLFQTIGTLAEQVALLKAQLATITRTTPNSPQAANYRNQIAGLEAQITEQRNKMAGSADALAPIIGEYSQLALEREFANRILAAAVSSAKAAQLDSQRKSAYVEEVSSPKVSDDPGYGRRMLFSLVSLICGGALWFMLRLMLRDWITPPRRLSVPQFRPVAAGATIVHEATPQLPR